ncbi:MAG: FtsX-like permease family protein [Culturomica sp.]|jgi:putative ABC transport system permease protein|nr:FtsX-like permease family protein [Culturomica sp.]
MNNFKLAFRALRRRGRGNGIKVLSLGLGLAVGLILITKLFYEYNYESFYPDRERICLVVANYKIANEEYDPDDIDETVSGGVACDLGREIPQIEAATRFFRLRGMIRTANRESLKVKAIVADSCLFDVLPRPMLRGDAKRTLSTPMSALVSRSLAEKVGGDAIGQSIGFEAYSGLNVVIGGIFEDVPPNTDFEYDMVISLASVDGFGGDGSRFWQGNDIYSGFVKLFPGVSPGELLPAVRSVQEKYDDMEGLKKAGSDVRYSLIPLSALHTCSPSVRQANLLMLLLAVSLLAVALLNYLIVTLSTVVGRAREVAVYKCYGAGGGDICRQMFAEAALQILFSLVLATMLVSLFGETVQEILKTPLSALFSWQGTLLVAGVCLLLLAVTSYIPARLFVRVPAVSVFRNFKRSGKSWKLALLFVQFLCAAAFCAILVVIWKQYNLMVNSDPGYAYENVAYVDVEGVEQNRRGVAVDNLRKLPFVESVATSFSTPFNSQPGNMVFLPESEQVLFNVADLYWAGGNYLDLMEIPIIEGSGFEQGATAPDGVLVNRDFAERISRAAGWSDGVVGKTIRMTEHGERTVVGVYENFRIGSIKYLDSRPSVLGYTEEYEDVIWIKLREMNGENLEAVSSVFREAMPGKTIYVNAARNTIAGLYNNERVERNSIVLCSLITLVIVLLGLIGYLGNEIGRRRSEIAIRKINGADVGDVLKLFVRDILLISVPALLAGSFIAYYVSGQWIAGFSEQITLSPLLFAGSSLVVLVIILLTVTLRSWYAANENPGKIIKTE